MKTQLFGIAAIVLAFVGSAFTSVKSTENNAKITDYYWYFNNPDTDVYELASSTPTPTPPVGYSCNPVVSTPQVCLKGFISDPGAANAATTTPQQLIQRQLIP